MVRDLSIFMKHLISAYQSNKSGFMKNALFSLLFVGVGAWASAQVLSITTTTTNTGNAVIGLGGTNVQTTNFTTTTQNGTGRNNTVSDYTFSNPGAGSTGNNTNYNNGNGYNNGYYNNNGYGNSYNNNGYGNSYSNNGYGNSYNYNNTYSNQSTYQTNGDGYGSTVEMEDENGNRTIIETTTDSTVAEANKSIKDKINAHIVHFTGLVMSDAYNEGNLSKAYVMDKYSEFLKPGKYNNINASLPNSVAYTFDGIAIPPKTRLVIYSGTNFTGSKLLDVTGPAIINNNKWEADERYIGANKKTYCPELQTTFPQSVRQWSKTNMHDWQSGSIEITEVTE